MIVKPFKSYFGGKEGNGTIQTLINHIPPHQAFCSLFLGNCAVTRYIKLPKYVLLNDLDERVVAAWSGFKPDLLEYQVDIDNRPAIDILKEIQSLSRPVSKYKPADTFIFLDPPYLIETRKSKVPVYRHEMTKRDHIDLLMQITAMMEYKIMICCYPNPLYEMWLTGWHYHDFYSTIRGGVALERIYYNYDLNGKLHDYQYLGGNFREREKFNRIKNNLIKKLSVMPVELRNSIVSDIITSLNQLEK